MIWHNVILCLYWSQSQLQKSIRAPHDTHEPRNISTYAAPVPFTILHPLFTTHTPAKYTCNLLANFDETLHYCLTMRYDEGGERAGDDP